MTGHWPLSLVIAFLVSMLAAGLPHAPVLSKAHAHAAAADRLPSPRRATESHRRPTFFGSKSGFAFSAPAGPGDEESLKRRDALLEKAQQQLLSGIRDLAVQKYEFALNFIQTMLPFGASVVNDPTSVKIGSSGLKAGPADVMELQEINSLVKEGNAALVQGDDRAAQAKWAEAGGRVVKMGLEVGVGLAELETVGLIAIGAEGTVSVGEMGRLLFDDYNQTKIDQQLKRQLGYVVAERARIKDALNGEVSGASFDPASLSPEARANRAATERRVAAETLKKIDRGRSQAEELGNAIATEQWRIAISDENVRDAKARLQDILKSAPDASSAGQLQISVEQLKRAIPSGWVPCTCPATHPNAGLLIDGQRWHTSALDCSMRF